MNESEQVKELLKRSLFGKGLEPPIVRRFAQMLIDNREHWQAMRTYWHVGRELLSVPDEQLDRLLAALVAAADEAQSSG